MLGTALVDSLTMVEDSLVQWDTKDGQTVLNTPSRINFQYLYLMAEVERADDGVTQEARAVLDDLNRRWHPLRGRLEALLDGGVEAFNEAVREAGIEPVERGRGWIKPGFNPCFASAWANVACGDKQRRLFDRRPVVQGVRKPTEKRSAHPCGDLWKGFGDFGEEANDILDRLGELTAEAGTLGVVPFSGRHHVRNRLRSDADFHP